VSRRYFGTDGVRGTVGEAPITPEFVLKLGQAAGRALTRVAEGHRPTVLIGKDTRISAICSGCAGSGLSVPASMSCCAGRCRRRELPT
jgi:phosphomannomutase